jgi:SAM-dependent methyltransferase
MTQGLTGTPHLGPSPPSPWVERFAPLVRPGGPVLDLACGGGRHSRLFAAHGHPVTAVDLDVRGVEDLRGTVEIVPADLENGRPWPLGDRRFAGIVVTNYLHRPLFPALFAALLPGGILLYETFMEGNERFGKPSRPEFLLKDGELLGLVRGRFSVTAYEARMISQPKMAMVQRIAARLL